MRADRGYGTGMTDHEPRRDIPDVHEAVHTVPTTRENPS
ncbi:hypothetical protein NOCA2310214 [metagenome]|uniref:Uncharacterized protein n=1 Tax=metagenome TaxID=256318 RepID=A0A2P2C606_9ZZZZ